MLIEYFTGFEHGGSALGTDYHHYGCGYISRLTGDPRNWCGPVTTPTRPDADNHGKYVLRLLVGKDGNTYYGLGAPADDGKPLEGFVSNPLYMSFFFRHNFRSDAAGEPSPHYGVWGIGDGGLRYCDLRLKHEAGAKYLLLLDRSGTVVATGSTMITNDTWYWIRMVVYKGATQADNYVKVYVGDTLDIDYSNIDLLSLSQPKCYMGGRWDSGGGHSGYVMAHYYDDAVMGSTWMPSDEYHVVYMTPDANGTHYPSGQWSPSDYSEVDERPHDADVTKVGPNTGYGEGAWWTCNVESSSTAGEHTGITPRIFAIRNMIISRKGSVFNHSKIRLKLGDDFIDSPSSCYLYLIYTGQTRMFQRNPWNGLTWTTAMLDDLEVGTRVGDDAEYWLTQAGIHVLFGDSPYTGPLTVHNFGG